MADMAARKICLAGKNRIAVDALLYMIERGWKDRLMVCPNRTDNGASGWQPSLLRFARELGIEVVTLDEAQEFPDLVFLSLEFDRIVQPSAFRSDRLYNLHFSALPAYKGMYTSALPILHGATHSGVTLHEIDHGIDTGPIIAQEVFDLPESWTARDLYFAYMAHGFELFCQHVDRLMAKEPPAARPQPATGSSYHSKAEIDYANLAISLRDTAEGVVRQLRAFSFREYQTPVVSGIEIGGWKILAERSLAPPGTVVGEDENTRTIATIDYNLQLDRSRVWEWFEDGPIAGRDPAHVDTPDKMGWTPLIRAAFAGDAPLCRRLLEAGADVNRANPNGTTPLMYALSCRDNAAGLSVARLLLDFGADPDRADRFGRDLRSYHPEALATLDVAK